MRRSVKDVACFAERYKATYRKYNQKFIIQTNSQWDARPCSQGNVFWQRASTHHDEKDKVRSALASSIMWRICDSGFIFEAVSTESAIQLATIIARCVIAMAFPTMFKVFARLLLFAPPSYNYCKIRSDQLSYHRNPKNVTKQSFQHMICLKQMHRSLKIYILRYSRKRLTKQ